MALTRSGIAGALLVASVATSATLVSACSLIVDFAGFVGGDAGPVSDASPAANDGAPNTATDGGNQSDGNDTVILSDANTPPVNDAPSSGPCSINAVQAVPGTSIEHVMTATASDQKSINETAGNLLVAIAYGGQGPGNTTPLTTVPNMTFTVTDTLGNTFFAGPMIENENSHQAAIQIFYAVNILGGQNSVSVTSAGAGVPSGDLSTGLLLQEYSGIATTDVVDVASGQMAPSMTATVVPGSVSTRASCDLVVGAFTDGHVSEEPLSAGTGWFLRSSDVWDPGGAVDNAQSNGSPQNTAVNATINLSSGADNGWVATQMAFRAATTSSLPQPDHLAFTTPARTVAANTCSTAVTIQGFNGSNVAPSASGISMTLSGQGVTFFVDPACAYPITKLSLGAGTSAGTFYFKGPANAAITATPAGLAAITQDELSL